MGILQKLHSGGLEMDTSVYDDKSNVDLKIGGLKVCKKCGRVFTTSEELFSHVCSDFFDMTLLGKK